MSQVPADELDEEFGDDLDDDLEDGLEGQEAAPRRHTITLIEMLISSVLSLYAAFVLSVDAIKLAADPFTELSCNISSKISCATVGLSWQAQALGFPNAFLGLIFEPIVITLGVAMLAGVRFPRWFMLGAQALYTIAIAFAYWLFLQAYFVIGALCPWCLLVTVTTTLVFAALTRINILDGHIRFPGTMQRKVVRALDLGVDWAILLVLFAVFAFMIITRYL